MSQFLASTATSRLPVYFNLMKKCCLCCETVEILTAVQIVTFTSMIIIFLEFIVGFYLLAIGNLFPGLILICLLIIRSAALLYWFSASKTVRDDSRSYSASAACSVFTLFTIFGLFVGFASFGGKGNGSLFFLLMGILLLFDMGFSLFYGYPIANILQNLNHQLRDPEAVVDRNLEEWSRRPYRPTEYADADTTQFD